VVPLVPVTMHHVRQGRGPTLLLIHGLGSSWRTWDPVLATLAAEREVIAVDLPGFGETPPLPGEVTIATLADAIEAFMAEQSLDGTAVVGSSMGGRLALELARRGLVGATVALDPGGFWTPIERRVFATSVAASYRLVKILQPVMPAITGNPVGRTALLAQFSSAPWRLPGDLVLREMRSFVGGRSFEAALRDLAHGAPQEGMARGAARGPIVIGWGRHDRVTLPRQAPRALARFPDARVHWFEHAGHFPHWDAPDEAARLILDSAPSIPIPTPGDVHGAKSEHRSAGAPRREHQQG